jgi:hypothetical protein
MAADLMAAPPAGPLFFLPFKERRRAVFPDKCKIFDHAHMVLGTVALIQRPKPFAGKISTHKAKADVSIPKSGTCVAHVQAAFPPRDASGTILSMKSLFFKVIPPGLVSNAQSAVHAAGGDQLFPRRFHYGFSFQRFKVGRTFCIIPRASSSLIAGFAESICGTQISIISCMVPLKINLPSSKQYLQ